MDREKFEKLVSEAISRMPQKFMSRLNNVDVVIEERLSESQKRKLKISNDYEILGLYEGIPLTKRGSSYSAVLPDKITIFKEAIERISRNEREVRSIIYDTLWHEIAHHFGLNEERVRKAEKRRAVEQKFGDK